MEEEEEEEEEEGAAVREDPGREVRTAVVAGDKVRRRTGRDRARGRGLG